MDVIQQLREQVSRDREMVKARDVMIDILEEAVARWRVAGFSPKLELGACEALVTLRMDTSAWALQQVGLPVGPTVSEPGAICGPADPAPTPVAGIAPSGPGPFWTPERDAELLKMRGDGKSAADMATHFGLSRVGMVHDRIYKLKKSGIAVPEAAKQPRKAYGPPRVTASGLELREWTSADDEALIAAYASDQPLSAVEKELDRTRSAIAKRIQVLRSRGLIKGQRPRGGLPCKLEAPSVDVVVHEADVSPKLELDPTPEQKSEPVSVSEPEDKITLSSPIRAGIADSPASKSATKAQASASRAPKPPTNKSRFAPKPGGAMVSPAARPPHIERAPAVQSPAVALSQTEKIIAQHVEDLPKSSVFDAGLDLELCEAVFGGKGGIDLFAVNMGLDHRQTLTRFELIVAPFRRAGEKRLPIETGGLILPALRARAAKARGAAA